MKHKLLAVLIALASPWLLCTHAVAHDFEANGIYYKITDHTAKTVSVTFCGNTHTDVANKYSGNITIPQETTHNATNYKVTGIDSYAFYKNAEVTSITIPYGITNIGDYAFYGCTALPHITIPASVTNIGNEAFTCTSPLAEQKILCLGNSITEFKGYDKKRYSDHIAELTGATVYNGGIGGAHMEQRNAALSLEPASSNIARAALDLPNLVDAIVSGNWEYQDVAVEYLKNNAGDNNTSIIAELKTVDLADIDIVTISIGTNDKDDTEKRLGKVGDTKVLANSLGGFGHAIEALLTANPNLRIYYFCPMPRYFENPTGKEWNDAMWCDNYVNGSGMPFTTIVDKMIENARYWRIPVCDMYRTLGINKDNIFEYAPDGTHPYYGYKMIANKMISFINEENNYNGLANIYFASNSQINASAIPGIVNTHLALNDENATDFNTAIANTYTYAGYTRAISEGKYGTIILPFTPDAESLKNYAFYALKESGEGYIKFEETTTPVANTPYLYTLRQGGKNVAITGGETTIAANIINSSTEGWEFIGSFTNQTIDCTDGNYYAYSATDNEINRITNTLTVRPFRAYFKSSAAQNSNFRILIGGATGITEITPDEMDDFNNNTLYDINGNHVIKPQKGEIYIQNGKKIIL